MTLYGERFPTHGDVGERPPDNFQFSGGDPYNAAHVDYLWSNLHHLENEVVEMFESGINATTYKHQDIDEDGDGIVDAADYAYSGNATTYKHNDIDVDGDGVVNKAQDVEQYKSTHTIQKTTLKPTQAHLWQRYIPAGYAIDFHRVSLSGEFTDVAPTGVAIYGKDISDNEVLWYSRIRSAERDVTEFGPLKLELGIENYGDTPVNVSGGVAYTIYET
jgi:hypothetical protein